MLSTKHFGLFSAGVLVVMATSCHGFRFFPPAEGDNDNKDGDSTGIESKRFFATFDDMFDHWFSTPFVRNPMPLLQNFDRNADMILRRSSPAFEITEDDKKFELAIDVPGVKASDMNIQVEQNGRVLRLTGERNVNEENMEFKSRFEKAFVLDSHVDVEKITANLADGVMVVTVPKKETPKTIKQISITEIPRIAEDNREQLKAQEK